MSNILSQAELDALLKAPARPAAKGKQAAAKAGLSQAELDDQINSGILSLMDAVEALDPSRRIQFNPFAELKIKCAILDGLKDPATAPRSLRRKKTDIERTTHLLTQRLGRAATEEEVARHLGITPEELRRDLNADSRDKGTILEGLRELDWTPPRLRLKKRNLERAYHQIELQTGRPATDEEVAKRLNISLKELHKDLEEQQGASLGTFIEAGQDGDGEALICFLPDPDGEASHRTFRVSEMKAILREALDLLPRTERFAVQLAHFDELTMKETGMLLNLSESQVSQLHTKAMLRLRGRLLDTRIEG